MDGDFILNIALHILILFIFLTIFYFSYISHVQREHINEEVDSNIDALANDTLEIIKQNKTFSEKQINEFLKSIIANKNISEKYTKQYNKNNKNIRLRSIGLIFVLILLNILIIFYFSSKEEDLNIKNIIIMNIIMFVLIGTVEFVFFKLIASQYIPVTPNVFMDSIVSRIKNNLIK